MAERFHNVVLQWLGKWIKNRRERFQGNDRYGYALRHLQNAQSAMRSGSVRVRSLQDFSNLRGIGAKTVDALVTQLTKEYAGDQPMLALLRRPVVSKATSKQVKAKTAAAAASRASSSSSSSSSSSGTSTARARPRANQRVITGTSRPSVSTTATSSSAVYPTYPAYSTASSSSTYPDTAQPILILQSSRFKRKLPEEEQRQNKRQRALCCSKRDWRPIVDPTMGKQFQLMLLVDKGEKNKQEHNTTLLPLLRQQGIKFDVRPLHAADYCWVATHPQVLDSHGRPTEFMVNWAVERKTIDDLLASITKGRYKEQLFRMRHSGLQHVLYLLEGDMERMAHDHAWKRLQSTLSALVTHVAEFVQTRNLHGTATQLAQFTHVLERVVLQRGVASLVSFGPLITPAEYLLDHQPTVPVSGTAQLVTFAHYQARTEKSRRETAVHLWWSMLCKVPGVGPVTATDIIRRYPLPLDLYRALSVAAASYDSEKALAAVFMSCNMTRSKSLDVCKSLGF